MGEGRSAFGSAPGSTGCLTARKEYTDFHENGKSEDKTEERFRIRHTVLGVFSRTDDTGGISLRLRGLGCGQAR